MRRTVLALLSASFLVAAPLAAAEPSAPAPLSVGANATIAPPPGWSVEQVDGLTRFLAPEGDARLVIVRLSTAKNGRDAADKAWALALPNLSRPIKLVQSLPAQNGWDEVVQVQHDVPPAEQKDTYTLAFRAKDQWTVAIMEGAKATFAKRGVQAEAAIESLRPLGFAKESFAGRTANRFDAPRIAALRQFVAAAMTKLRVPGVGLAIVDQGRIVYEGGIGVRDIRTKAPVTRDTRFMVASNTKGMTTLLLATLVDEGRLDWNKPVVDYMPEFRLGSAETTRRVLVKHLVCACTGLPRKDMEWIFNTAPSTAPETTFGLLAQTEPTSGFGEVYQYNNLMASAAGYLAARILYPDLPLGAAYDRAMQERIFDPLGMRRTTFDDRKAQAGDWARPHGLNLSGRIAPVAPSFNANIAPYRPAGGAWSSAHDMALYLRNELAEGQLAGGKRMVSAANLLARRQPNVQTGENVWYGMGLEEDRSSGVAVVSHGGSLMGYKSNWFAVPSANAGVVLLTNSDRGYALVYAVKRRMLELLYDGKPEAAEEVANIAERSIEREAKTRTELDVPAAPRRLYRLLGNYSNPDLGRLTVRRTAKGSMIETTSVKALVTTRGNQDGTVSLVTIEPGFSGFEFLATRRDGKPALVLDDGQHEYVFVRGE